jgi:hypothetical protein
MSQKYQQSQLQQRGELGRLRVRQPVRVGRARDLHRGEHATRATLALGQTTCQARITKGEAASPRGRKVTLIVT